MTDEKMNEAVARILFNETIETYQMQFSTEAHENWFDDLPPERQQAVKRRCFLDTRANYLSPDWSGVKAVCERMETLGWRPVLWPSARTAAFGEYEADADTFPRAVMLAALRALGFALRDGEWVKGE